VTVKARAGELNVLIELPSLKHVMNIGWREHSACATLSKNVFFDYNLVSLSKAEKKAYEQEALDTCASCPVKAQCYEFAVKNNEKYGIWAGTFPDQRKALYEAYKTTGVLETL
jgi:WhiB family redox-sensing transcriptional regulator